MATPASHLTTAGTLMTAATTAPTAPRLADLDVIEAHATLGAASGTGDAYAAAESALTDAAATADDNAVYTSYAASARLARCWAQLADRA